MLRWTVRGLVAVALLLALSWATRNHVLGPLVLRAARARVAEQLGLDVRVGALRGDWTSELELEDLRADALTAQGALRRLHARSVALQFDLRAALRGEPDWLRRVELRDADAVVDLAVPDSPGGGESGAGGAALPAGWPELVASNVGLRLRLDSERALEARRLHVGLARSLSAAPVPAAWFTDVERLALDGEWPLRARSLALDARGALTRERVAIDSLALTGAAELTGARAELDLAGLPRGEIGWRLMGASAGGEIALEGRHAPGELALSFEARELDLERASAWFAAPNEELALGVASLRGELQLGADGPWIWAGGELRDSCVLARPIEALTFEGAWTPRELWLAALDARVGDNELRLRHVLAPLFRGDWSETARAARGQFELAARDVPTLVGADPQSVPAHTFLLAGELDELGLELRTGALRTLGGDVWLERGAVLWGEPGEDWIADASLDLELLTEFSDLAPLGALIGERAWRGGGAGAVRVRGPARAPWGELDVTGERIAIGELGLGDVEARARLGGGRLEIERLQADGELGALELSGRFDVETRTIHSAEFRVATGDIAQLARAVGVPDPSGYVTSGAVSVEGRCSGALVDPDATALLEARDVVVADGRRFESLRVRAQRVRDDWRIDELSASSGAYSARLAGRIVHTLGAESGLAFVDAVELSYQGLDLALARPATVSYARGRFDTSLLELAGSAGSVSVTAHSAPDDVRLGLSARELEPLALAAPFLPLDAEFGPARGELELVRSGDGWSVSADLELHGARWGAQWPVLDIEVTGRASEHDLELERLRVDGAEAGRFVLEGAAQFQPQASFAPERMSGGLRGAVERLELGLWPWSALGLEHELRGRVDASFDLAMEEGAPSGRVRLDAAELAIRSLVQGRWTVAETELTPVGIVLDARLARELVVESCDVRAPGRIDLGLSGSLGEVGPWLASAGQRRLPDDAPLALRASWSIEDLRWAANFTTLIRRIEGAARGELRVGGSWGEPRAEGSWSWTGGALRLGLDAPPFERIEARGVVADTRVELDSLRGELGAGPFELSGWVDLADEGRLELALSGRELLVLRGADLRVRADADLRLSGTFAAPAISGRVGARDGRWRQRIEWLPSSSAPVVASRGGELPFTIRGGPLENLSYDIAIDSAGSFLIDTNLAKINLRPALRLGGRADAPTLEGAIFLDPARISLPGSTLDLRSGTLLFDPYSPTTPMVDVTATARVLGYDVTARLTGRSDALDRELSSTPPLRSEDISMLLLTGRAPRDVLSNETSVDTAQTVILFLGQDLFSKWYGGSVSDGVPLMERFEFRAGADATRAGGSTAQVSVRVSGAATGTGSAMYLRGEKDIYDRINYGVRWVVRMR